MEYTKQLARFGVQQGLSCLFPAVVFCTLAISKLIDIPLISRYDFILIVCIFVQWLMVYLKVESIDELKVISIFHIIGIVLEIFKVHMGSWSYPEDAFTKIGGVPLYSGFMYASVASYICQAWKRFDLQFINWPSTYVTYPIAVLIYINFFAHHFLPDMRWYIILILLFVFGRSRVFFELAQRRYSIQVIQSFFLIGFFIWLGENIATFLGAWKYPDQLQTWQMVHLGKISSWYLLVIISIIIVANLKHLKYGDANKVSKGEVP